MSLLNLLRYKTKKILFTTPSHAGKFFIFHKIYQWYKMDISEVDAYNPQDALLLSEKRASEIYGVKYTKFLTNGSTCGVIAAILASKAKRVLIWDKAHPCHKNGAKLAGCEIFEYSSEYDESLGVYKPINEVLLNKYLSDYMPDVVVITSPTYEGFVVDIEKIMDVCNKHSVKLIVDEAHGALYPFSDKLPRSAVKFAHYTIQSLHKTAGGINPTALLHSNDNDPTESLKMINTTSPSYVMLASIEANINFLNSAKGRRYIANLIDNIKELNIPLLNDDPTKIILKKDNLTGFELSQILFDEFGIEDEKSNDKTVLLLCGVGTTKKMLNKLKNVLSKLGF